MGTAGVGLPPEIRAGVEAVRADLAGTPFLAPEAGRLAELGLGRRELAAAVRAGALFRIADGIYLLPGADAAAAAVLAGLAAAVHDLARPARRSVPPAESRSRCWNCSTRRGHTRRGPDDRRTVVAGDD